MSETRSRIVVFEISVALLPTTVQDTFRSANSEAPGAKGRAGDFEPFHTAHYGEIRGHDSVSLRAGDAVEDGRKMRVWSRV